MKIFFITSKLNFVSAGGSVEEFDLIIKTLQKWENEVTVITVFSEFNDIPTTLSYSLIQENIVPRSLWGIQKGIFKILQKYESQADVFHLDGHLFLFGAGAYRRWGGKIPVSAFFNRELTSWPELISVFFGRSSYSLFKKMKRGLRYVAERYIGMFLANGIDLTTFISPFFQQAYEDFGLRKKSNSLVIGDPIDWRGIMKNNSISSEFYCARNKIRQPITLFYSSRMAAGKGFDVLLKGFSEIKKKENFRLVLGGNGPEEKKVRAMIQDLQLTPYVDLLGWVSKERLYELHKTVDIFIQADWMPIGTSISLVYAMAFGIPSILPAGGGLAWMAGDCALYFSRYNTKELAQAIEKLGNDPELRSQLSRNCYRRLARPQFDYEYQINLLYQEMGKLKNEL